VRVIICDRCGTNCTDGYFSIHIQPRPFDWETPHMAAVLDTEPDEEEEKEYFDVCPDCRADIVCNILAGKKEQIGDIQ